MFCRSSDGELESSAEIVSTLEIEVKNGVQANFSGVCSKSTFDYSVCN